MGGGGEPGKGRTRAPPLVVVKEAFLLPLLAVVPGPPMVSAAVGTVSMSAVRPTCSRMFPLAVGFRFTGQDFLVCAAER